MSQKLRADVDRKFIRRFLIISLGCFAFMLWGLYDGLYTSPTELDRAVAYKKLQAKMESGDLTEGQRSEAWEAMCKENGWTTSKPKSPEVAQNYVYFQWFVFGIGLVLGLLFLWHYMRLLNAWVEADDDVVSTSWGQSFKFDDITGINKAKWQNKGIAKVAYEGEDGKNGMMVFDDFKFHRETMGQILRRAERDLEDDQITYGARESSKDEEPAQETSEDSEE